MENLETRFMITNLRRLKIQKAAACSRSFRDETTAFCLLQDDAID